MTFLNPAILFGLIAAAIPLIIHLFNFRRPRSIDFSSLAFLEELRQQTMRRLRLKQWLLLALRMLAIACLVLAFARPTVEGGMVGRVASVGRTSAVVILDNTVSMQQRDENGDYFSQARDELLALAEDLDAGDELTVVPLIPDEGEETVNLASPVLVADWLREAAVRSGRADMGSAIERATDVLNGASHPNKNLIIISDFQATTFPDSLEVGIDPAIRSYLIPIGSGSHDNVAITRVEVVSTIVDQDQQVSLKAEVSNFGETDRRNWGLGVHLGPDRVAQATIDLDAGETSSVNMVLTPAERGWLPGWVEMEDDDFDFDNRRFFTLHVPQVRRILLVKGEGTDSEYLELAVSRELSRTGSVFAIDSIDEKAFSSASVSDFDAVILYGLRHYSSGQTTTLTNFVDGGGGLFILVGDNGSASDQLALIRALGGGVIDAMEGQVGGANAVTTLDAIDPEHPIFTGIFERVKRGHVEVGHPAVYKLAKYRAGSGDEQTVVSTTSEIPFLQEIRGSQGRVLLMPFLPEPGWTDLPRRGLFVPMMHRSMYYLTSSEGASGEGVIGGSETQFRVSVAPDARIALVSSTGEEWIPEQRGGLQGLLITVPASLREPGVYDLTADGEVVRRIAVNGDPAESNLARVDPAELASRFETPGGYPALVLRPSAPGVSSGEEDDLQAGIEIWNVFLGLALLFLVVEMLVAKR